MTCIHHHNIGTSLTAVVVCVQALNDRYFGGRRIEVDFFDGVTNYKVKETAEEEQKRIEEFGEWLEQ